MSRTHTRERLCMLTFGGALLAGLAAGIVAEWCPMPNLMSRFTRAAALLLPAGTGLSLLLMLIRQRRRLRMLQRFTSQLGRGEFPPPLRASSRDSVWIAELKQSLNYLRDRFHSTVTRLKTSGEREQELRKLNSQRDNLKSRIFGHMLPELRIPLNRINGQLELLNSGAGTLENIRLGIRDNLVYGSHLIDRLCEIAVIGNDSKEPVLRPFSLHEFWKQLIENNLPLVHESFCELDGVLENDLPEHISTDKELLMQILTILIRAISRASGRGEHISCRGVRSGKKIIFRIFDHRRGHAFESLAEKFNAQDPAAPPADENMILLGLSFAGAQAEKLNGTLSVHSSGESNAVLELSFDEWVLLGAGLDIPAGARYATNARSDGRKPVHDACKLAPHGERRILVIGRDQRELECLAELFAKRRFVVDCASIDDAAFTPAGKPSLVVLSLPEPATGLLSPTANKLKSFDETPVLLLHGLLSSDEKRYLTLFNWRHTLAQPVDFDRLFQMADALCE